ncbi:polysaccharide biosynthesis protein [Nitratireductor mangrovi]|uniref:Polysaccharide biosynthesis protein n=1 Tax=Nitratireductor mangrovi TaxID=2599600 RepID=A0A5B8KZT1_9HYPH|nr:nucleoside-diphosphate sugar epimerase/dehydratase [Nitratireductor mangrovi]QDZ01052.1 polysaccharide biosynthesis protein [Nitratireductor mangrovi]
MRASLKSGWSVLRRTFGLAPDIVIAYAAFAASYAITLGHPAWMNVPGIYEKAGAFTLICAICIIFFGVHRASWRYASIPDLVAVLKAALATVAIYTVAVFLVSRGDNVPRSVPILSTLFLIAGLCSVRLAYRLAIDGNWKLLGPTPGWGRGTGARNVILVGLSHGAESYIRAAKRLSKDINIAGIVDDAEVNHSRLVQGVKVIGGIDRLPTIVELAARHGRPIDELIVTELKPSRQWLSEMVDLSTSLGIKVSRIPDLTATSTITNNLLEPKAIELGDLLGRPEVETDFQSVARLISGGVVLATGAGGSIGSELCRQIASFGPKQLIITDSSEHHLYMLDKELRGSYPDLPIVTRIVNVRDRVRVEALFREYKPSAVFHAAALKHVPLVEENPIEGIKTNVLGTCAVANAALANDVSTFVMISTDKAVNPTNIMGATKRAAEAYCQALDVSSEKTRFKTVRFGNVLGSNGSVVPRFQEQIAEGGPVTVTHPHIVRYFMTIPEAVRLVLHASGYARQRGGERGKIMVLDMGKPVRIVDLAERMIQLAGYRPRVDIDIVFTGLRPGEKLYEELFDPSEIQDGRTEEGFVVASPRVIDKSLLLRTLDGLRSAVEQEDVTRAIKLLTHIVPEYAPKAAGAEDDEAIGGDRREPA